MASLVKIDGVRDIQRNLCKADSRIRKALERGVVKAGLYIQRESQRIVPVDTGNLKASAFTRKIGSGVKFDVIVGYTASYAIYVHENIEEKNKGEPRPRRRGVDRGNFWDPPGRGQSKFLETPAREGKRRLIQIVRKEAERL